MSIILVSNKKLIEIENYVGNPSENNSASLIRELLEIYQLHKDHEGNKSPILKLLQIADLGILDLKVVVEKGRKERGMVNPRIKLLHQSSCAESWLDLQEESQGTQTLFRMAAPIFESLLKGRVLLVDELESSLHPLLGLEIVRLFNSPKSNPNNAQLIFTTHDTNLLGNTVGDPPLRRDQIWFTEKDKEGATRVYPLTDYKPRKEENLERGYLQGRYGAIPFIGHSSWITE